MVQEVIILMECQCTDTVWYKFCSCKYRRVLYQ